MNIALVYFSATNNTRHMARVIKKEFEAMDASVDLHDVTTLDSRNREIPLADYDAVVFGFPIHSLRAPRVMRGWLKTLRGGGMKCAMFFTFGGFMVHPAHHSTARILEEQGFVVVSSADFPGKHTYNLGGWKAFPQRPDSREFTLAREYTAATYDRFSGWDRNTISELEKGAFTDEQLDAFEQYRFKVVTELPHRGAETCSMCGLCEESCPTKAMDHVKGLADPALCIACLRCVDICPEEVIRINSTEQSWNFKLSMGKTTEREVNSQVGRMYL